MTTQPHSESIVIEFLDSFLQEKNIKWILATGMLILLGSSLMVVMPHWDTMEPTAKFLTVIGYTGAIFAAGWWSYHKLALRRTGTTLLALTVLLIPVSFMAWHWCWAAADTVPGSLAAVTLLALNLLLAAIVSHKTFRHFLRGDQPTFFVCYLILCLAGSIGPSIRETGLLSSWLASLVLWGVFSVGVVKVNRHVFWLTEERRQSRVFGFFPILLLGGQFLGVFAANFASALSVDWMGLGCVLVAIPVLLTADAVAKVFQERTGDVVRPLPWPIILPFTFGLILCIAGIVLAATPLPQRAPFALAPTAALAASLMAVTARRTNQVAFVWSMLIGIVLAYNFSPVFFQSAARGAIAQGAAAVHEARLPYAFYGLTYLPLVLVASGVAALVDRQGVTLFARPMRRFCVGISWVLLAASLGHAKALLPVAIVMLGVFACQARLFWDRRLALAAIIAFLIAAAGSALFVEQVFAVPLPATAAYFLSLGAAVALLVACPWLDPQIRRIPLQSFDARSASAPLWTSMSRTMSLCATVLIAVAWTMRLAAPLAESLLAISLLAIGLLLVHSLVWMRPAVSWFTYAFAATELLQYAIERRVAVDSITPFVTIVWLAQWGFIYLLARHPQHRVSRANVCLAPSFAPQIGIGRVLNLTESNKSQIDLQVKWERSRANAFVSVLSKSACRDHSATHEARFCYRTSSAVQSVLTLLRQRIARAKLSASALAISGCQRLATNRPRHAL